MNKTVRDESSKAVSAALPQMLYRRNVEQNSQIQSKKQFVASGLKKRVRSPAPDLRSSRTLGKTDLIRCHC